VRTTSPPRRIAASSRVSRSEIRCFFYFLLEQRRHVPDDRRSLGRGTTLLHPPPYCRRGRLLVERTQYPRRAEPPPSSLQRCFWAATSPPSSHIGQARRPARQRTQQLAAIIHLCNPGSAEAFSRRSYANSTRSVAASFRSAVSNPSVNQS
jgi:hypothetical protein